MNKIYLEKLVNRSSMGWLVRLMVLILCLSLLCSSVSFAGSEPADSVAEPVYNTLRGRNVEVLYNPEMLLKDANTGHLDPDVAKLTVVLADAAYEKSVVNRMLQGMAFSPEDLVEINDYGSYNRTSSYSLYDNDYVAYTIAHLRYGAYNLYIVPVRGTKNNEEWFSNFNLSDDVTDKYHAGFYFSAVEIYQHLSGSLRETENNIVVLTGHSRGAAVSNLVGGLLMDRNANVAAKHLFCYNYATPAVGHNLADYSNILNVNNEGDLIALLPRARWGYERYGIDISIGPFAGEQSREAYELALNELALNESDFEYKHFAFDFLAYCMICGDASFSFWDFAGYLQRTYPLAFVKYLFEKGLAFLRLLATGSKDLMQRALSWIIDFDDQASVLLNECLELKTMLSTNEWEDDAVQEKVTYINSLLQDKSEDPIDHEEDINQVISNLNDHRDGSGAIRLVVGMYMEHGDNLKEPIWHGHQPETYVSWVNSAYCGYKAFQNHKNLTGEQITEILSRAGTTVGNYAFAGCENFQQMTIPSSIRAIGNFAFSGCTGLTELEIPNNVIWLGQNPFEQCANILAVKLPVELSKEGQFNLPNVQSIHYTANSTGIMPDRSERNTYYSSSNSFIYNTLESNALGSLRSVVFDEGVTHIADYAFALPGHHWMTGNQLSFVSSWTPIMESVVLPTTLASIGDYAFINQMAMHVTVSGNFTDASVGTPRKIGKYAFWRCENMPDFPFYPGLTEIDDYAFDHCLSLRSVVLPDGVTRIGRSAFEDCPALTELFLPDSVVEIQDYAFVNCNSLMSVTIPDGVQYLGAPSFSMSDNATDLTIPADFLRSGAVQAIKLQNLYVSPGKTGIVADEDSTSGWDIQNRAANIVFMEGVRRIGANFITITSGAAKTVTLPDSLESIGDRWITLAQRYYQPPALVNPIPAALREIGAYCYQFQNGLNDVVLPETVEAIGEGAFYCVSLKSIAIPDGITRLPARIFSGCGGLRSVVLPETLRSIGSNAFSYTGSLKELALPEGLEELEPSAFAESAITSIVLPEGITEIPEKAFYNCTGLAQVSFSDQLQSIGPSAFYSTAIERFTVPAQVTELGSYTFSRCGNLQEIVLHENVTALGDSCFAGCTSLQEISLPEGIATIGKYCFSGCAFSEIVLPQNLQSLGGGTFSSCASLQNVRLPAGMEELPDSLFYECTSLTGFQVPDTVHTIRDRAFYGCSALTEIGPLDQITALGENAFAYTGISEIVLPDMISELPAGLLQNCEQLKQVTVPDGVTVIGAGCFSYSGITGIDLPSTLLSVEHSAFSNCSNLEQLILPDSVTSIGSALVEFCINLKTLKLPNGITEIPNYMAAYSGITELEIPDTVITIGAGAFEGTTSLQRVVIPASVRSIGNYLLDGSNVRELVFLGSYPTFGKSIFYNLTCVLTAYYPDNDSSWWNTNNTYGNRVIWKPLSELPSEYPARLLLPSSLTIIEESAFANTAFTEVVIPESVECIGAHAFDGSAVLTVKIMGPVQNIGEDAFANTQVTIVAPSGSYAEQYASENGLAFQPAD